MPRHTEVGAPWGEGGATREQLLSSEPTGSAGGRPGGRRGKQPASSIVRRYLDEGLRASLASRSTEATIARVDAAADLDEMLDVHDEPWLQPSVQESLGKVWAAFAGPDAAAAAPETVGAIVDATLPGLVSVIAQEHTHGIKSSLWRRFEEYSNTIEGKDSCALLSALPSPDRVGNSDRHCLTHHWLAVPVQGFGRSRRLNESTESSAVSCTITPRVCLSGTSQVGHPVASAPQSQTC